MKKYLFLFIAFLFIFIGGSIVSAVQSPAGWWNVTGNMSIGESVNMSNEYNQTDGNLTLYTGAVLNFTNVNLNFTYGQLNSANNNYGFIWLYNSTLSGNNGGVNNQIYILRYTNITFKDSIIQNWNQIVCENTETINSFTIENSTIRHINNRVYFNNACHKFILNNSIFYNSTGAEPFLKIKGSDNFVITNNNISWVYNEAGINVYNGANDGLISNNDISEIESHGIVNLDSNYTVISNNRLSNIGKDGNGYAIDTYGSSRHVLVENNTVVNASNGIVFSLEDLSESGNITSIGNQIYNISVYYGLSFSNIELGGFSSKNDYIENTKLRGISIRLSENGTIKNLTLKDNDALDVLIDSNNNITFSNLTIINPAPISFNIISSNNTLIEDSLIDSLSDYYFDIDALSNDLTFINVLGYNFSMDNATDLDFNISASRIYYKSMGSTTNIIQQNSLSNALIYNTNGSIYGSSNIQDNDGNINITLTPGNAIYVLDNFNLTESNPRENSPLTLVRTNQYRIGVTNSLDSTLTGVPIIFDQECSNLDYISYQSDSGLYSKNPSYTCTDNVVTIPSSELLEIEPATGSNELLIYLKSSGGGSSGGSTTTTETEPECTSNLNCSNYSCPNNYEPVCTNKVCGCIIEEKDLGILDKVNNVVDGIIENAKENPLEKTDEGKINWYSILFWGLISFGLVFIISLIIIWINLRK